MALMVAERAHANQTYDIFPYMYHIHEVVNIAKELGYDETIQIACALHDAGEDDTLTYNKVKKFFGKEVAEIFYCVTDELGRNRQEKKLKTLPKIASNWKATAVKICDRIANFKQSSQYNPDKCRMYVKEHTDFCEALMNDAHPQNEVRRGWDILNAMVENQIKHQIA